VKYFKARDSNSQEEDLNRQEGLNPQLEENEN
jgi:hypothetical protein